MISFCVTVKNRSRVTAGDHELALFPNCVESIVRSAGHLDCELVVADWESDDWPLDEWLSERAYPISVRHMTVSGEFSRGAGRNRAALAACGDELFFVDADILLSRSIVTAGLRHLDEGKAYFPIVYAFKGPEHVSGWWRREGYGTCMVSKTAYDRSGGWPEYETWGREDTVFFHRVRTIVEVVREKGSGLYHQWHPEDPAWKDRYSRRVREATATLARLVPSTQSVVLIDKGALGIRPAVPARVVRFLDWGKPYDDEHAIHELEALRDNGVSWLAFGWLCHWWLDYYEAFQEHLRAVSRRVYRDENLIAFELSPKEHERRTA